MKLVYTRWKDVKKFLASLEEPVSIVFYMEISSRLRPLEDFQRRFTHLERLRGKALVWDIEIPRQFIDGSYELLKRFAVSEDSRTE